MEKMLFSGVQSNSEVALIAIKGIKNQPGIAAKVFGAIAEEKINVELILQSIGRGENKDISTKTIQKGAYTLIYIIFYSCIFTSFFLRLDKLNRFFLYNSHSFKNIYRTSK